MKVNRFEIQSRIGSVASAVSAKVARSDESVVASRLLRLNSGQCRIGTQGFRSGLLALERCQIHGMGSARQQNFSDSVSFRSSRTALDRPLALSVFVPRPLDLELLGGLDIASNVDLYC